MFIIFRQLQGILINKNIIKSYLGFYSLCLYVSSKHPLLERLCVHMQVYLSMCMGLLFLKTLGQNLLKMQCDLQI